MQAGIRLTPRSRNSESATDTTTLPVAAGPAGPLTSTPGMSSARTARPGAPDPRSHRLRGERAETVADRVSAPLDPEDTAPVVRAGPSAAGGAVPPLNRDRHAPQRLAWSGRFEGWTRPVRPPTRLSPRRSPPARAMPPRRNSAWFESASPNSDTALIDGILLPGVLPLTIETDPSDCACQISLSHDFSRPPSHHPVSSRTAIDLLE